MIPGDVHIALAKVAALIFLPALVGGVLLGLIRQERAIRRAAWPGWAYYVALEIGVLADKKFPFLWSNLTEMVPLFSPPLWLELVLGALGGALSFLAAGGASELGFRLAARLTGFAVVPVPVPAKNDPPVTPERAQHAAPLRPEEDARSRPVGAQRAAPSHPDAGAGGMTPKKPRRKRKR